MSQTRRSMKRKNMLIDQRKLTAAKQALGTDTETATVDAALDLVVFRAEVFSGLDASRRPVAAKSRIAFGARKDQSRRVG